jgi:hypothetical protein
MKIRIIVIELDEAPEHETHWREVVVELTVDQELSLGLLADEFIYGVDFIQGSLTRLKVSVVKDSDKEPESQDDWRDVAIEFTPAQAELVTLQDNEVVFSVSH